jgi:hypothetical protein
LLETYKEGKTVVIFKSRAESEEFLKNL